jgi:hypothetical protein
MYIYLIAMALVMGEDEPTASVMSSVEVSRKRKDSSETKVSLYSLVHFNPPKSTKEKKTRTEDLNDVVQLFDETT